jgi:hypothetical protein
MASSGKIPHQTLNPAVGLASTKLLMPGLSVCLPVSHTGAKPGSLLAPRWNRQTVVTKANVERITTR